MNSFCFVLLPLFLPLLWKETRGMRGGQRALWWLLLIGLSGIMVSPAYDPYRAGRGVAEITTHSSLAFAPTTAINSLDAAILHLHLNAPVIAWIAKPLTWNILAAMVAGSLLLLGVWLVENLELALLFASWVVLAFFALSPQSWPWGVLLPLTLAICSSSTRTILLAFLLAMGAALSYYFWLGQDVWVSHALVTIGLSLVIWGWWLFFTSTWRMTRGGNSRQVPTVKAPGGPRFSRASCPGRPTWPGSRER